MGVFSFLLPLSSFLVISCGNKPSEEEMARAEQLIESAHKAKDYTVQRKFREAEYEITIRPNGAQKGVKAITLDGQPIDGTVIPYSPGKHVVEATM